MKKDKKQNKQCMLFYYIKKSLVWVKSFFLNFRVKITYNRFAVCLAISFLYASIIAVVLVLLQINRIGVASDQLNVGNTISISNPVTILSAGATIVSMTLAVYALAMNAFSQNSKNILSVAHEDKQDELSKTKQMATEILCLRYRGFWKTICFPPYNFPLLSKLFSMIFILILMLVQTFIGDYRIFYLGVLLAIMLLLLSTFTFEVFYIFSDKNFFYNKVSKIMVKKIKYRLKFLEFINRKVKRYFSIGSRASLGENIRGENIDYAKVDIAHAIVFLNQTYCENNYRTALTRKNYIVDLRKHHYEYALLDILKSINASVLIIKENESSKRQQEYIKVKNSVINFINDKNILFNVTRAEMLDYIKDDTESKEISDIGNIIKECIFPEDEVKYEYSNEQ